jgi:hypothetical protein
MGRIFAPASVCASPRQQEWYCRPIARCDTMMRTPYRDLSGFFQQGSRRQPGPEFSNELMVDPVCIRCKFQPVHDPLGGMEVDNLNRDDHQRDRRRRTQGIFGDCTLREELSVVRHLFVALETGSDTLWNTISHVSAN